MKKKYVIYGIGKEYEKQKQYFEKLKIVAYVDNTKKGEIISECKRIISIEELSEYKFDWIIITNQKCTNEIIEELIHANNTYEDKIILLRDFINESRFIELFFREIQESKFLNLSVHSQNSENIYYIIAPANLKSGGPELLHQLAYELRRLGKNVYIAYDGCKDQEPNECIPNEYIKYIDQNVIRVEDIPDENKSTIILPETKCNWLEKFERAYIFLWWMSVDNMFINISNKSLKMIYSNVDKHLYQSEYARGFLKQIGIPDNKIAELSDYINEIYIQDTTKNTIIKKVNIVAYNPAKGRLFTQKIIREMPETKFVAIQNMTNTEVFELLKKSKVYIDFGNHPGKDRIPREAAMLGCCVITGRRGAAGNDIDVCIPDKYKFDESKCDIADICEQIKECLDNYEENISDFEEYREKIRTEKSLFEKQVKEIFK